VDSAGIAATRTAAVATATSAASAEAATTEKPPPPRGFRGVVVVFVAPPLWPVTTLSPAESPASAS
jgi:hypothetical protein